MAQHPAIDKWARKKFTQEFPEGTTFRLEQGTYYGGYCETCRYEEEEVEVFVKEPGQRERLLHSFHTDLATIMQEVLDASL